VDLPRALPVDDQRVLDPARVDHHRGELHAVEEPEAGVGHVEVHAHRRQAQRVVHGDGGRRFEVRAAHRAVDEQPDPCGVDPRLGERLRAGHGRGVDEAHVARPPAALR
jgi:hypothetical protein